MVAAGEGLAVDGGREELDFQFDEELDRPLPAVKQNTFTEWSDSDSESEEVGDDFINKILIVTQSNRAAKHEGYDRTGDWTSRTKISQDLVHHIEDGLRYYEQDLWNDDHEWAHSANTPSSFKVTFSYLLLLLLTTTFTTNFATYFTSKFTTT